jgi:hypothetical protein
MHFNSKAQRKCSIMALPAPNTVCTYISRIRKDIEINRRLAAILILHMVLKRLTFQPFLSLRSVFTFEAKSNVRKRT